MWGYSVGATGPYRFCQDTPCQFLAGVHLPAGAILTRVQLDACDDSATHQVAVSLARGMSPNAGLSFIPNDTGFGTGLSGMPGCVLLDADIDDLMVDNVEWVRHRNRERLC